MDINMLNRIMPTAPAITVWPQMQIHGSGQCNKNLYLNEEENPSKAQK